MTGISERTWPKDLPPLKLNINDIVEAFPEEAKKMVPREKKNSAKKLKSVIARCNQIKSSHHDLLTQAALLGVIKLTSSKKEKENYVRLRNMERLLRDPDKIHPSMLTQPEIDMAKNVPIENLGFLENIKKVGRRKFASCPYHLDDTPSLIINASNSYHCFSCGDHGDGITLVMKNKKLDFKDAVRWINELKKTT